MKKISRSVITSFAVLCAVAFIAPGCALLKQKKEVKKQAAATRRLPSSANFPMIHLPEGFEIEKVAEGLTYPTSITWDDKGQMYVAEAGGTFLDEKGAAARILRIQNGKATEVVNLAGKIYPSISGMTWHNGAFYITHREKDLSGAVSRVTPNGQLTQILGGIVDSKSDHQPNDLRMGTDGKMYVCVGIAGNSGYMDQNMIPFVLKAPDGHPTPAKDIVLTGINIELADFRTESQDDKVLTGAFMPFGTETKPAQIVKGSNKAGGTILVFDPNNAEATVRPYAWGFRNIIGLAWNKGGNMFAVQNGYDNAAGRPINDAYDPTFRVKEGAWYGWPDFTANGDPVTSLKYKAMAGAIPTQFKNGERLEKGTYFLIDHQASGLTPPDKSNVLGLHEVNSSPSKPDIAPASWGKYEDMLFVPEYGDFGWITNPMRDKYAGNRIAMIKTGGSGKNDIESFIQNTKPGPASEQGKLGDGIERPYDVKFGPDGAMYIVDFGAHRINLNRIAQGQFPIEFQPKSGMVWKVTKVKK